jgi:hypothetical protein
VDLAASAAASVIWDFTSSESTAWVQFVRLGDKSDWGELFRLGRVSQTGRTSKTAENKSEWEELVRPG